MSVDGRIIAAVRNSGEFERALSSNVDTVFCLYADIRELAELVKNTHSRGKRLYIHIDLATGLGKDKAGIEFAKAYGIDGIISTRTNLIKIARECGLKTVQRFFIVDSASLDTSLESLRSSKADMMEIMPGILPKIIKAIKKKSNTPIIAGGLIETEEEIVSVINSGATAVSTGDESLWNL